MKAKSVRLVRNYIMKSSDEQYKRAEEIEKLKILSALTGGTIHDLNNILTTISGYADIILSRNIDERLKNEIMIIKKSAEDGSEITGRIKNYIRNEEKISKIFDINESIDYAVLITKPIWHNQALLCHREIEVSYVRKAPIMALGNEKELREAFETAEAVSRYIINRPQPENDIQVRQVKNDLLQFLDARVAIDMATAGLCEAYGISVTDIYHEHEQKLINKGYLQKKNRFS
jgi:hypothetical protein